MGGNGHNGSNGHHKPRPAKSGPKPRTPIRPIKSIKPIRPIEPIRPIKPSRPIRPIKPIRPSKPIGPIRPIGPIKPIKPSSPSDPASPSDPSSLGLPPAVVGDVGAVIPLPVLAGAVHLFLDAAVLEEVAFLPFYESADEGITLVNQGDGDVRDDLVGAVLNLLAIDGGVEMRLAEGAGLDASRIVIGPLLQSPHTEIILIIEEEFVEGGTVHVGQFQLHLAGGDTVDVSFCQVLFAGACGLYHLVDGPVAGLEELVGEKIGDVEDAFRLSEGQQRAVVVALTQEILVFFHNAVNAVLNTYIIYDV